MAVSRVTPLQIEAVGDDFVQLSGVWVENARVAQHVLRAEAAWAFEAADAEGVQSLMGQLSCGGRMHIIAIAPGKSPDWPREGRAQVAQWLGSAIDEDTLCGLLLALAPPDCDACRGGCGGCHT